MIAYCDAGAEVLALKTGNRCIIFWFWHKKIKDQLSRKFFFEGDTFVIRRFQDKLVRQNYHVHHDIQELLWHACFLMKNS